MYLVMKKLIAGNWKMNTTRTEALTLLQGLRDASAVPAALAVCPPFVHLALAAEILAGTGTVLGAQDCGAEESGAFTGDISAAMLRDYGCHYVILGHSERRQYHQESSALVARKTAIAVKNGLKPIVCIGETQVERDAGTQEQVVSAQLAASLPPGLRADQAVIAYEPVWAIGTGKVASPADVEAMHGFIRRKLNEIVADSGNMRILYGGSVKPDNAAVLMHVPHVDGALVGGASLKADQFLAIAAGCAA